MFLPVKQNFPSIIAPNTRLNGTESPSNTCHVTQGEVMNIHTSALTSASLLAAALWIGSAAPAPVPPLYSGHPHPPAPNPRPRPGARRGPVARDVSGHPRRTVRNADARSGRAERDGDSRGSRSRSATASDRLSDLGGTRDRRDRYAAHLPLLRAR